MKHDFKFFICIPYSKRPSPNKESEGVRSVCKGSELFTLTKTFLFHFTPKCAKAVFITQSIHKLRWGGGLVTRTPCVNIVGILYIMIR